VTPFHLVQPVQSARRRSAAPRQTINTFPAPASPLVVSLITSSRSRSLIVVCYRAASVAAPSSRNFAMSRLGALPKRRVYSRLNCDALR